jgi:hypothetical protein
MLCCNNNGATEREVYCVALLVIQHKLKICTYLSRKFALRFILLAYLIEILSIVNRKILRHQLVPHREQIFHC